MEIENPVGEAIQDRFVEVLADCGSHARPRWRCASGFLIDGRHVLTSLHAVIDGEELTIRRASNIPGAPKQEWPATLHLAGDLDGADLAILTLGQDIGSLQPAGYAQVARRTLQPAVIENCSAVGFPRFTACGDAEDVVRDTAQVDGRIPTSQNLVSGLLTLQTTHTPQPLPPSQVGLAASPWSGMSGAAVMASGRIIGVVSEHAPRQGPSDLTLVPITLIDALPDADVWWSILGTRPADLPILPLRRTAGYFELVRDIAPAAGLRDREQELAELAAFCAGDEPYVWWQGEPWAGKTALLSSFVLDPPTGIDVVSFFVTAPLAAQNDSDAFTDALLDQLAAIAAESLPVPLHGRTDRDAHRHALLKNALAQCRQAGRQLVLVVDGLDEDRGAEPGSGRASIASLLPKTPMPGLHVIVSGRPSPDIPSDVVDDHPLRSCRRRLLKVSPHAKETVRLAGRELGEIFVRRVPEQLDTIGLIAASGGGLTVDDIEEIVGFPRCLLSIMLDGTFGRTIAGRVDGSGAGTPMALLFTHETLWNEARDRLGSRSLTQYRCRLHGWADRYRDLGWPANTPRYLFRGYPRMLRADQDHERLVGLALDEARHSRIRHVLGGDAASLREVEYAQETMLDVENLDLAVFAQLAVRRDRIAARNAYIPTGLPAVWALLGQFTHAEALAHAIPDPLLRRRALTVLEAALAALGEDERANALAATAQSTAVAVTDLADDISQSGDSSLGTVIDLTGDPDLHYLGLMVLADAISTTSEHDWLAVLGEEVKSVRQSTLTLADVIEAVSQTMVAAADNRPSEAAEAVARAEAMTRLIHSPHERAQAWAVTVVGLASSGMFDSAERAADRLQATVAGLGSRRRTQGTVFAARLSRNSGCAFPQMPGSPPLGAAVAVADQAAMTVGSVAREMQAQALAHLVKTLADVGSLDRARRIAGQAEHAASFVDRPEQRARTLTVLARALLSAGLRQRAEMVAGQAEDAAGSVARPQGKRALILALLAKAFTEADQPASAAQTAEQAMAQVISLVVLGVSADPKNDVLSLAEIGQVLATAGLNDHAAAVIEHAETLTAAVLDPLELAESLTALASVASAAERPAQVTRLANRVVDAAGFLSWATSHDRVLNWNLLTRLACGLRDVGCRGHAEKIASAIAEMRGQWSAMRLLRSKASPDNTTTPATGLQEVRDQWARAHQRHTEGDEVSCRAAEDRALAAVEDISDLATRVSAAVWLTRAWRDTGNLEHATALITRSLTRESWAVWLEPIGLVDPDALTTIAEYVQAELTAGDHDTGKAGVPPHAVPGARVRPGAARPGGRWQALWTAEPEAAISAALAPALPVHGAVLGHHRRGAVAVATTVLPDGRAVAVTCGHDETVQIWDLAHGHRIGPPLSGHNGSVWSVTTAVLPNGTVVAVTSGRDGTVRVWDLAAAEQLGPSMVGHCGDVVALATATLQDGRVVAVTGGDDRTVRVWDLLTRHPIGEPMTGHTQRVVAAETVHLQGGRVIAITAGNDATVRVWDLAEGRPVGPPMAGHTRPVPALRSVTMPNGDTAVLTGGHDGTLRLWNPATGQALRAPCPSPVGRVSSLATTTLPGGRPVTLVGGVDAKMAAVDPFTGASIIGPWRTGMNLVSGVAATELAGHPIAVTATFDNTVQLWHLGSKRRERSLDSNVVSARRPVIAAEPAAVTTTCITRRCFAGNATAVATASLPGGRPVAVIASWDDRLWLCDLDTGDVLGAPMAGHTGPVLTVATAEMADGRLFAITGGADHTVRVWDLLSGSETGPHLKSKGHSLVRSMVTAELADGRVIVIAGGNDSTVQTWDLATRDPLDVDAPPHTGAILSLATAVLRNDRVVAVSGSDHGTVRIWDPATGQSIGHTLTVHAAGPARVATATLTDGRVIAALGDTDGTIRRHDIALDTDIGEPLRTGHCAALLTTTPSSGHPAVISVGNGDIHCLDLQTGRPASAPLPTNGIVHAIAVHQSDTSRLVFSTNRLDCAEWDRDR